MERCLYRLAKSPFADRFILKGALLLAAWRAPVARPTMDIDLAGKTSHELEHIRSLVGEICAFATEPDDIELTAASIRGSAHQGRRGLRGCARLVQRDAREGENRVLGSNGTENSLKDSRDLVYRLCWAPQRP
jgi:hypothetical protein